MSLNSQEGPKKIFENFVIDDFVAKRATLPHCVEGPQFPGGPDGVEWTIRVYPRGKTGDGGFGAYLHLASAPTRLKSVVLRTIGLALTDDVGGLGLNNLNCFNLQVPVGGDKGFDIDETGGNKTLVAKSGKLIVRANMIFSRASNTTLADGLLLTHPHHSIFTIVSSDGRKFPTAGYILQLQIPYVYSLFNNEQKRLFLDRLHVKFDGDTVATLMHFVDMDELITPSLDLLKLACEWKMSRLLVVCGNQLADHLTVQNAVGSLLIAKQWWIEPLKWAAEKFVNDHHTDALQMINDSFDREDKWNGCDTEKN